MLQVFYTGKNRKEAQLAGEFAKFDAKARSNILDNITQKDLRYLLQLEKVDGLNIQDFEDTIGLDTSILHNETLIATFEKEEFDGKFGKKVYKPIKQYYQKSKESDEYVLIGEGDLLTTDFMIDGFQIRTDSKEIKHNTPSSKITQRQIAESITKKEIEKAFRNETVTQISEVLDYDFRDNLKKQCDIEDLDLTWMFIVSTIDEKGKEDFDIIFKKDFKYHSLTAGYGTYYGMSATNDKNREVKIKTNADNTIESKKTLKEFVTKTGQKYVITKNSNGELEFSSVTKENANEIEAQQIDTLDYKINKQFNHKKSKDNIYKEYIKYRSGLEDKNKALSFSEYLKQIYNINIENYNQEAINNGKGSRR